MPSIADLLVITVNQHETDAVIKAFETVTGARAKGFSAGTRQYFELGTINGAKCVLTISEMGAAGLGSSHQAVSEAIADIDPQFVIAVGIAFGVNEKKQKIGDILVSKHLWLYELQKKTSTVDIHRGEKPHASSQLLNLFRSYSQVSWTGAEVKFGVMLTGEKLIDDVDYRNELIKFETEAIGGEMEGAGIYVPSAAKNKDWIIIKAICDWADGNKSTNKSARQKKAAKNAAEFLVHCLKQAHLSSGKNSKISKEVKKNKIIIDFAKPDSALGVWISEKLKTCGFDVWNRITAPLEGDTSDSVFKNIAKTQTSQVIVCLSGDSLHNEQFRERRIFASACDVKIIPLELDSFDDRKLEDSIKALNRIDFTKGWGSGYSDLIKQIAANQGFSVGEIRNTSNLFMSEQSLIQSRPEVLASNQYEVVKLPKFLRKFRVKESLGLEERSRLFDSWPATELSENNFVSFFPPTSKLKTEFNLLSAKDLLNDEKSFPDSKSYRNTIIELCRKSFIYHCKSKGLQYCDHNNTVYFPQSHPKIKVKTITGKNSTFAPTGERTFKKRDVFRYQMAPVADLLWNSAGMWMILKIRIRITDKNNRLLKSRSILPRRIYVCKNWWNDEWLKRSMGVMQFLSKDSKKVQIGGNQSDFEINAMPDMFDIAVSIDENLLTKNKDDERDELLPDSDSLGEELEVDEEEGTDD